jgi:transcriptional regulator with XRE-family HTH domain
MFLDKKEVGQRILQIRKKYGYSMQKFGEIIDNAPKGSVNSWEKGVNLPNEKRLKQIATLGNMTLNELLYGSFNEYVDKLVGEKLGIQFPEEFSDMFYQLLQQNGFTYGDDMEIIRLVNGFMSYHNLATKETAIFYQPTPYSGNYFEGIIQKADYSVLVCKAYADRESNTLHIIPAYGEEKNEEQIDFFHALDKLTLPHKNNYFTSGFLTLGLTLRDSKIICYGINKVNDTAQATPYEYDCNKDAYVLNENLTFTANDKFLRESTKEALFLQYEESQA